MFSTIPLRCIVILLCAVALVAAQNIAPLTLQQMTDKAGFIFSGRVVRVQPVRLPSGALASMAISVHVERAIRGVKAGQTFSFNEWAGLWQNGNQRYRVGDHVVLFLYPRSPASLTSPVGGQLGRVALNARGNPILKSR